MGRSFSHLWTVQNISWTSWTTVPASPNEAKFTAKGDTPQVPPPLCPSRASQDVSVFNVDALIREVNKSGAQATGQAILDRVVCTPFERLRYLKGELIAFTTSSVKEELDTQRIRYNTLKAKLGQVDSRRKELLKELQSLDDQKKDLNCQVAASKDLL
ncbi:hypothetical protein Cgig2_001892 [Carnegiea gigantea]|uniref:Uncharacterized protein n=1 Tax=Carnegiea gigantea TaxID=171969 RepID=A0A9Q1JMH2_9CARY|nr:hypothetical protein Cgig2_001892 [Carnegiea gigantea]